MYHCLLTNHRLLPPAFHLPAYYLRLLTPAYQLLPETFCLLTTYYLLPAPCYLPHSAYYQRHAAGVPKSAKYHRRKQH